MRTRPVARSCTRCASVSRLILFSSTLSELALEYFRIVAPPGEPVLRDVAGINVLDPALQGLDDRCRERRRRQLRRQDELIPLILDWPRESVDDANAGRQHLRA